MGPVPGELTNIQAIKKFFGMPGETLTDFTGQYKKLTDADRTELGDACRKHYAEGGE